MEEAERTLTFLREILDRTRGSFSTGFQAELARLPMTRSLYIQLGHYFGNYGSSSRFDRMLSKGELFLDVFESSPRFFQIAWRGPGNKSGEVRGPLFSREILALTEDLRFAIGLFNLTVESLEKSLGISFDHPLDEPFV